MTGFSISLGGKKPIAIATKATPAKSLGKRPRAAFLDDGVPADEQPSHQEISGFDAEGAAVHVETAGGLGGPMVIKVPPNPKRQKSSLPTHQGQRQGGNKEESVKAAKAAATAEIIYGLNVPKPRDSADADNTDSALPVSAEPTREKSEDDRALEALMSGKGLDSNRVIPAAVNEDEAFSRDYIDAPEVPSQADYDAVPIEQFGAALLRGMGWKDGQGIGKGLGKSGAKIKVAQRRPAMLGVGAAPQAALGIEIGAWGKQDSRGKKTEAAYNPVVLKNKITGETITQDELNAKLAEQARNDLVLERSGDRTLKSARPDETRSDDHRKDRTDEGRYMETKQSARRERSTSYDERRSSDQGTRDRKEKRRDRSRDDKDRRYRDRSRDRERRDDYDRHRDQDVRKDRGSSRNRGDRYDEKRSRNKDRDRHSDRHRDKERDRRRHDDEDDYSRRSGSRRDHKDRR